MRRLAPLKWGVLSSGGRGQYNDTLDLRKTDMAQFSSQLNNLVLIKQGAEDIWGDRGAFLWLPAFRLALAFS